jgi:DNA-binding PadR family transcriptional regulator
LVEWDLTDLFFFVYSFPSIRMRGMTTKRSLSNPLALAILACLIERPMHPYEMAQTMRERHKHESVKLNYGSLYTVVEALERAGLIVPQETQRQGRRPERTVYAIAEAGREKFYGWLRSLISKPVKEYPQFAAGLSYIAALARDEAVALLEERAGRLAQDIAEMKRSLNELMTGARGSWPLPRLVLIELEYELHMKEAELAWVRQIVADEGR